MKEKTFKCKIIYKQAKESKLLEFDINAVSISDARGKAYDHFMKFTREFPTTGDVGKELIPVFVSMDIDELPERKVV